MAILRRAVRILGPGRPRALGPLAFAAAAGFATLAQAYDSIEVVGYDVSAYNNGQTINWWGASYHGTALAAGANANAYAVGADSWATAIGAASTAAGVSASAFGNAAQANGINATALGAAANATGGTALAAGYGARASGDAAVAYGAQSIAAYDQAIAVGYGAAANNVSSTALGFRATAGVAASAATQNDVAVGAQASAVGGRSTALGYGAAATALDSLALGEGARAGGVGSVAIGPGARANGASTISIGVGNVVNGANSGAIGDPSIINGANSYSVGNNNVIGSTTQNAFALGNDIYLGATAAGVDTASVSGAVALGQAARVTVPNGVALGAASVASVASGVRGFNALTGAASTLTTATWQATLAAISVGDGLTATRQIGGVAAGRLDTDAVNVAQLVAATTHYFSVNSSAGGNYANNGATGTNAVAIAQNAVASNTNAVAVGPSAAASGNASVALGYTAQAIGQATLSFGVGAVANTQYSVAIGRATSTTGQSSLALGGGASTGAVANGTAAVALGGGSLAYVGAQAVADYAIAIGAGSVANIAGAAAIGRGASATAGGAIALGLGANSAGASSVTIGGAAQTTGQNSVAIGADTLVSTNYGVALGRASTTSGEAAVAIGAGDAGRAAIAAGTGSVAIGGGNSLLDGARAQATYSLALGAGSVASQTNAIALGRNAQANGAASGAFGFGSTVASARAYALGDSIAIAAGLDGAVALGSGAVVSAPVAVSGATIGGVAYSGFAGAAPVASVSVGGSGAERQIQNVAAGQLAATSTDAVNGSQLYAVALAAADAAPHYLSVNDGGAAGANFDNDGATGLRAAALGYATTAVAADSLAIGANASAYGVGSIAQGAGAVAGVSGGGARYMVAIGATAQATAANALALGYAAAASGSSSVVVGANSVGSAANTVAIGRQAGASASNALALGSSSLAYGSSSIAIGLNSVAGVAGQSSIGSVVAVGDGARAVAANAVAMGRGSAAAGLDTTAVGPYASAASDRGAAFGLRAAASGLNATSIGGNSTASGVGAVALGGMSNTVNGVRATAAGAVAIGANGVSGAEASGIDSIAMGPGARASADGALAIGARSQAAAASSGAFGVNSSVASARAYALGDSIAIAAGLDGAVALGSGAVVSAPVAVSGATIGGVAYSGFAGAAPVASVSVGGSGAERQIQNVAAGQLAATSTDAVNGSQLYAVAAVAAQGWTLTTAQTGSGVVTGASLETMRPGAVATFTAGDNVVVAQNGAEVRIATSPTPVFDSVTTGAATMSAAGFAIGASTLGANGLALAGGPSITTAGVDAGGLAMTRVAAGVAGTDAVNVDQLAAVSAVASAGWNLSTNGGATSAVAPGATMDVSVGPNAGTNLSVANSGANLVVDLSRTPVFDSVTTGAATMSAAGFAIGASTLGASGLALAGGPSVTTAGVDAGGLAMTRVAAGVAGTDAVNLGQLNAAVAGATGAGVNFAGNLGAPVHVDLGGQLTLRGAATTAGAYAGDNLRVAADAATGALHLEMAQSPRFGGVVVNAGGAGVIAGLAAGSTAAGSDEAVNGGQINTALSSTAAALGGGAAYAPASGAITAPSYGVYGGLRTSVGEAVAALQTDAPLQYADPSGAATPFVRSNATTLVGADAGAVRLRNLAPGVTGTDAVNVDQLAAVSAVASAGWNLSTNGGAASAVAPGATMDVSVGPNAGTNLSVANSGANLVVDLSRTPVFDSVTTGAATMSAAGFAIGASTLGANGLALAGGPSITTAGVDAGGLAMTRVAAGVAGTDAVNVDQLAAVSAVASAGWNLSTNGGAASAVAPGATMDVSVGPNAGTNLSVANSGANLVVDLSRTPVFDSVTTGAATMSAAGFAIGASTLGANGLALAGGPSITTAGVDAGGLAMTRVAAGVAGTDAVNVDQLAAVSAVASAGWTLAAGVAPGSSGAASGAAAVVAPGASAQFLAGDNLVIAQSGGALSLSVAAAPVFASASVTTGGALVAGSTGVVNGGQIAALADSLANVIGATTYDSAANAFASALTLPATGATTYGSVQAALDALGAAGLSVSGNGGAAATIALGATLPILGAETAAAGLAWSGATATAGAYSAANVQTYVDAATGRAQVQFAAAPVFDGVTTGAATMSAAGFAVGASSLGASGLVLAGGPAVTTAGIDAGGRTVGNVAAGVAGRDAVNVDQLAAVSTLASAGWNVSANGGAASHVAPGATLDVSVGANAGGNLSVANAGGALVFDLSRTPVFDGVTTGGATMSGAGFRVGAATLDATGLAVAGGPSVTTGGIDASGQAVRNVAAGVAGRDAVNLDQLNAAIAGVSGGGGGSGLTVAGNGGAPIAVAPGATVSVVGAATTAGSYSSGNVRTVADQATGALSVEIAEAPRFGSVVVNEGGSGRIGGVAAGSTLAGATDAVNGGQINTAMTSTAAALGGGAAYDPATGAVTAPTYQVYGETRANVGDAIAALQTGAPVQFSDPSGTATPTTRTNDVTLVGSGVGPVGLHNVAAGVAGTDAVNVDQLNAAMSVAGAGFSVTGDVAGAGPVQVRPGQTLAIRGGATTAGAYSGANLRTVADPATGAIQIQMAENPVLASVTTGAGGVTVTGGGAGVVRLTGAGLDNGGNVVANVAAGVAARDAVNVSQLGALGTATAAALGGGATYDPAANSVTAPSYAVYGAAHGSVGAAIAALQTAAPLQYADAAGVATPLAPSNDMTLVGAAANRPVVLHNVAAGLAPTDAVNLGQLNAVAQAMPGAWTGGVASNTYALGSAQRPGPIVLSNLAAGEISATSTQAVNGAQLHATNAAINNLAGLTQQGFERLQGQIDRNRKNASAGVAGATALGMMRFDDRPGKFSMGVSAAGYDGQGAVAVGAGYTSPDQAWRFSAGVHFSPTYRKSGVGAGASLTYTLN